MKCNLIKVLLFYSILLTILPCQARKKKKAPPIDELNISMELPHEFGKTHFIVGYPFADIAKDRAKKTDAGVCFDNFGLVCAGKVQQSYFAPDDNIQKVLLYLINEEKKSIKLTAYSFTDGDVAQALIDAMHRGVAIELVVDPACIMDRFGKVRDLQEVNIDVYVYNPNYLKQNKNRLITSIMHNKFIVFESNILGRAILWTGSFNFTKSAHLRNQENVLVLDDEKLIAKYKEQFERLKTRARPPKHKKNEPTVSMRDRKGTIFEDMQAYA